jgi:hypothetical protein
VGRKKAKRRRSVLADTPKWLDEHRELLLEKKQWLAAVYDSYATATQDKALVVVLGTGDDAAARALGLGQGALISRKGVQEYIGYYLSRYVQQKKVRGVKYVLSRAPSSRFFTSNCGASAR